MKKKKIDNILYINENKEKKTENILDNKESILSQKNVEENEMKY